MSRRARDSYPPWKPDHPPRPSGRSQNARSNGSRDMYQFGGPSQPRSNFSFRSRISQRELLTHVPSSVETSVLSENHASNKFRDVENLTDSEEEEMSEDEVIENNSRLKRRKLAVDETDEVPAAKWSNPDPYTALPPAPDSTHKRVDVVKLIRKARNDEGGHQATDANQADFISFESFGNDDLFTPPSNAPTGPRADPQPYERQEESATRNVLGKRKHDAFLDDTLMGPVNRTRFHKSGRVLAVWQSAEGSSSTPWLKACNSRDSPMTALHKEIIDFHEWVKPKDFEAAMRRDLVDRLAKELRRWKPGGKLEAFGSYAAGLYLPTGDMDLVYNYAAIRQMAQPKNDVYAVTKFLETTDLARPGTIQPIAKAKVPIVKFVDGLTGLKVDLSFNNDTGITANETFKEWQVTYPAVSIIVAVIKQFLMIRGLNDNASGGLGGFATICMVTSLVQNMPNQKNHNLGELLVEFFNLYGNLLNVQDVAIRLDPPGYLNKRTHPLTRDERAERLVILDPNRPDNNITGGSSEYPRISGLFSRIYDSISSRLDEFADRDQQDGHFSFLADVIGGDFSAYNSQRVALSNIYNRSRNGTVSTSMPQTHKPPQPLVQQSLPTPSQNASASKSQSRLSRILSLFPELASKFANFTSVGPNQVVSVGGWTSKEAMNKDIASREQQQIIKAKKAKSKTG